MLKCDVIEPDLKMMIATHDKLVKGEKVEQNDVSVLLLGGIINILSQHDTIAALEERMKSIEHENVTSKNRIESLEEWIQKQDEAIKGLDENIKRMDEDDVLVKENTEIGILNQKVISLELDRSTIKSVNERLNILQKEMASQDVRAKDFTSKTQRAKVLIKCKVYA